MQTKLITIFATVFLAVLGWIWQVSFQKLASIQIELQKIKIELIQIQSQIITEERVKDIIDHELLRRHIGNP